MSKREILVTRYGEMCDMLACFAIDAGASQKKPQMTMEDILFDLQ